jgi:hypothetical protein
MSTQVHAILECRAPVILLVHAVLIGLGECGVVVQSRYSDGELAHWMECAWAGINELLDELGKCCTGSPIGAKTSNLFGGGNFSGQKQPEKTLWKGLIAACRLGKKLLALRDASTTEANALL